MRIDAARTMNELISAVSMAMDIEENVKLYHGWRVAIVAARLADAFDRRDLTGSFYGGLLQDVGAVGLPHHLVHYFKDEPSDRAGGERRLDRGVVAHPLFSAEIVSSLPGIADAARAVLNHHENWNGHGFPRGLRGDEIDLDSQILHAADATDLILRRAPFPDLADAAAKLANLASVCFSPDVADRLVELLRAGLYERLADSEELPEFFESVREEVGDVPVERGVDAIGVTLDVLSQVVDNKHAYTIGHSRRVARYSLLIGIAMGLEHDALTLLKWATLIHDVGKLSVPASVLDKPAALSDEEYGNLKFHASYSFDIISMITDLRPVAAVASSHHERYDGAGYPFGWSGDDIPLGGRIMAVADAFDAMTSSRPYRSVNDVEAACEEIEDNAGTQFDPRIVRVALPVLRNMGLVIASGQSSAFTPA